MNIDGLLLINEYAEQVLNFNGIIYLLITLICLLIGIIIFAINMSNFLIEKNKKSAIMSIFCLILWINALFSINNLSSKKNQIFFKDGGKNFYECEIINNVDIKSLYENYEIISYENNILTLKDK